MGKPTGFMDWGREHPHKRPVEERVKDDKEFVLPLSAEEKKHQAGRCMDCGVPFCHQGCPLGNMIPDFNDHVFNERWKAAWEVLSVTNDFPEFTGRLCPAPCEASCVLAIDQDAVAIEQTEKEIIERAFAEGWVVPRIPTVRTGKRVAVVGSGPAGLAAASRLNRLGHEVVVFERSDRVGGLLRYGIPDFKMEKWVIDRRLAVLEAEGIAFRTGVDVGVSPSWKELRAEYDAVVIAIGAMRARALDVEGSALDGVMQAMPFLENHNRGGTPIAAGKRVVILGGGDTGSDCLGTSIREGAASVMQVELMPAPPEARTATNPWPQWPYIFRTSSSQDEGGDRVFARRTTKIEGVNGKVTALHWVDSNDPTKTERIEVDLVIQAMGFVSAEASLVERQLGVKLDARGNVQAGRDFTTTVPGVFAAGDAKRGASLIVWAIAEGRDLAKSVDRFLQTPV